MLLVVIVWVCACGGMAGCIEKYSTLILIVIFDFDFILSIYRNPLHAVNYLRRDGIRIILSRNLTEEIFLFLLVRLLIRSLIENQYPPHQRGHLTITQALGYPRHVIKSPQTLRPLLPRWWSPTTNLVLRLHPQIRPQVSRKYQIDLLDVWTGRSHSKSVNFYICLCLQSGYFSCLKWYMELIF